jgi:predicted nucleotide-binding protein
MKERFEDTLGHRRLIAALQSQRIIEGDKNLAASLADGAEILELSAGQILIQEGAADNDVYFILVGTLSVQVKGKIVAQRSVGEHVGEMSVIDPSQPRAATIIANETCVVAKVSEPDFSDLADAHPVLWRNMARELSRRLIQRAALIQPSNDRPQALVISSSEALPIAREIQSALAHDDVVVQVWTDGVFFASGYSLEALEHALDRADFAIAIAQPDDIVESRGTTRPAPRDNVVFELGLFMGRLGRRRTVLLQPVGKELKLPSDLHGLTAVGYRVGAEKDLTALLAPACNVIRKLIMELGVRG